MPIQREGKYLVTHDFGITSSIGIESDHHSQCVSEAKSKKFEGVFGTEPFGFREDNLDFLTDLGELKQVWFSGCKLASVQGLYSVSNLQYCLMAPEKREAIDYSRFDRLRTLTTHWNARDVGLRNSSIKKLYYWRHKPRSKSFEGTEFPEGLELLELNWVNPASLVGINPMPELKELGIHRSRNIQDLSLLPIIAPNLETLDITACGRATNLEGVIDHPSIKRAYVNDKEIKGLTPKIALGGSPRDIGC